MSSADNPRPVLSLCVLNIRSAESPCFPFFGHSHVTSHILIVSWTLEDRLTKSAPPLQGDQVGSGCGTGAVHLEGFGCRPRQEKNTCRFFASESTDHRGRVGVRNTTTISFFRFREPASAITSWMVIDAMPQSRHGPAKTVSRLADLVFRQQVPRSKPKRVPRNTRCFHQRPFGFGKRDFIPKPHRNPRPPTPCNQYALRRSSVHDRVYRPSVRHIEARRSWRPAHWWWPRENIAPAGRA